MPWPITVLVWIGGIYVVGYYIVMLISSRMHVCCVCEGLGFKFRRHCAEEYRKDARDKDETVRLEVLRNAQAIASGKAAVTKRVEHGRVKANSASESEPTELKIAVTSTAADSASKPEPTESKIAVETPRKEG